MPQLPTLPTETARRLGELSAGRSLPEMDDRDILSRLWRAVWPGDRRSTVFDLVRPGEATCFVVSDHTRTTATDRVLPIVVDELVRAGCRTGDMCILFATGIHRAPNRNEIAAILGPEMTALFSGRVFVHDADDDSMLVEVGTTRRGHLVRVNRRAMEADRLVPIGSATYHYHAGFGGGCKSLVPGLASRDTIAHTHSLSLHPVEDRFHPGVEAGRLEGNPVAEELLEAAAMCSPDIIVNTVVAPGGTLVGLVTGELEAAHRRACRLVEDTSRVDIPVRADIVLASASGATNWIQSHKALYNAHRAMKPGGRIVLDAPCPEGLGNERFRYWVRKREVGDMCRELRRSPEVNGQTALSSRIRGRHAILVTGMPENDTNDLGIRTATDMATAVRTAITEASSGGERPTYYLMPHARHTVPFLTGEDAPPRPPDEAPIP